MKNKSASQSAFFNPRVLIALFVLLSGVFLALAGLGVLSAPAANIAKSLGKYQIITSSTDALVPVGFDCSTIYQKGIDKQENMRAGAIMIACGQTAGGSTSATTATSTLGSVGQILQNLLAPLAFGAGDVDLVTGGETSLNVTQSETYTTANPDNPNQIVVAYNDSRGRSASPINISGASVSTDGGATFTRLTCAAGMPNCTQIGQSPFANTVGDPVILYNNQPGLGSRSGSTEALAVKASAGTSPPRHRTRIAGPISQFTTTTRTTESLVMRITTQPRRSLGECTFPGMTSM
jgi:hypothetical protein